MKILNCFGFKTKYNEIRVTFDISKNPPLDKIYSIRTRLMNLSIFNEDKHIEEIAQDIFKAEETVEKVEILYSSGSRLTMESYIYEKQK